MFARRLLVGSALCLLACSDVSDGAGTDAGDSDASARDAAVLVDGGGIVPESAIYAHSGHQLYKLDPDTLETTLIGTFDGCSIILDIAVDRNSRIIGSANGSIYNIDKDTAACTRINTENGAYPNSLSFVPIGTLDPNKEVLVGYSLNENYMRIDPATGATQDIGPVAGGYSSSGDIVSVKGLGTFLTANHASCATDCLVEIEPTTGEFIKSWGDLEHNNVWGLAYWGGVAYGFDSSGTMFSITFHANSNLTDTVAGTVTTTDIDIPNAPADLSFFGAGSTTIAPIVIQ